MITQQTKRMYLETQTPERTFEAILHFAVYNEELEVVAASYISNSESVVKGMSAAIIERRKVQIGQTILTPLSDGNFRKKEKAIGMGDVHHGIVFPRHSVWNDIIDDELMNKSVTPYIFVTDGTAEKTIGMFLQRKFALPECWTEQYFSLLSSSHYEELSVIVSPEFNIWNNLRVFRLLIKKDEMIKLVEKNLKVEKGERKEDKFLQIPKVDATTQGIYKEGMSFKDIIIQNAIPLAHKLSEVKPHYDPETEPLHWSIRLMKRTPFPAQAYKIQGLTNALLTTNNSVFDCGDMGTGSARRSAISA